jgi:hypothetical protein
VVDVYQSGGVGYVEIIFFGLQDEFIWSMLKSLMDLSTPLYRMRTKGKTIWRKINCGGRIYWFSIRDAGLVLAATEATFGLSLPRLDWMSHVWAQLDTSQHLGFAN